MSVIFLELQLIERTPHITTWRTLVAFSRSMERPFAVFLAVPVAMRVGRKGEQNVFADGLCQVDRLGAGQFDLAGEFVDSQWKAEWFEAMDALQLEIDGKLAGGEKTISTQPDIERIVDRTDGSNPGFMQVENTAALVSLEVLSFRRNLLGVDLHNRWTFKVRLSRSANGWRLGKSVDRE